MLRVLVVDDDPVTVAFLESLLRGEGHMVQTAPDGAAGLERARAMVPDVLLTDIEMPGLTGNQLAAALRADPRLKATYVIVLTVHGEKGDRLKAFLSGADDFLAKPAGPAEVVARLALAQRVLRTERDLREARRRLAAPDAASVAALQVALQRAVGLLDEGASAIDRRESAPARGKLADARETLARALARLEPH